MSNTIELPDQAYLKSILDYNPLTGVLIWKPRTVSMFTDGVNSADWSMRRWNTRHAGREAITSMIDGYKTGCINGQRFGSHRVIWKLVHGVDPESIDHINHDRADNRIENLRSVTGHENQRNRPMQSNNKSGVVGVYWYKITGKWAAAIKVNRKRIHLGYFDDIEEAKQARERANVKYGFHANHGLPT